MDRESLGEGGEGHAVESSRTACVSSTCLEATAKKLHTTPESWQTQTGTSTGATSRLSHPVLAAKRSAHLPSDSHTRIRSNKPRRATTYKGDGHEGAAGINADF